MSKKETGLPPAGNAREEELKKRTDKLEEQGEKLATSKEKFAIDPKMLEPDFEIIGKIDELRVPLADNDRFVYCWVCMRGNGRFIYQKKLQGWAVVQGDMPEAPNLKGGGGDTTRVLGDTMLMRMSLDRYILIKRDEKKKRENQEESVKSVLLEMGDRFASKGVIVRTDPNSKTLGEMAKRALASETAKKQIGNMVREGTVPSMEIGR